MNTADVIGILKQKQGLRSIREFAKELNCSAAYLSDLYRGNRQPGPKVMRYLGLNKTRTVQTTYRRMKAAPDL